MDLVVFSTVQSSVLNQRRLLCFVDVLSEPVVKTLDQLWHDKGSCHSNIGHDRVDDHGLDYLEANIQIPLWHVVMVRSLHILGDERWLVLSCLSVHKQKQETRVEELSVENSFRNGWLLLTLCVFSYPVHQINDEHL